MTNLEGSSSSSQKEYALFSWHHGDATLVYVWIILIVAGSTVAIFQSLSPKARMALSAYNYWVNTIMTGSFLFITEWRLGKRYNLPATYVKPILFSMALAYYYYYMNQRNMYLEAYMVSFMLYIPLIPLWTYGPNMIPKRPGSRAKRLAPVIKIN